MSSSRRAIYMYLDYKTLLFTGGITCELSVTSYDTLSSSNVDGTKPVPCRTLLALPLGTEALGLSISRKVYA